MQRVAMTRKRANRQPCVRDHRAVVRQTLPILQQRLHVEMIGTRPSAGPDLERLHFSERLYFRQHLPDVEAAEHRRKQAKLQRSPPTSSTARTFVHTPPLR